jgi:hypothetical protein
MTANKDTKPYCPVAHTWRGVYHVKVFDQELQPIQETSKGLQTVLLLPTSVWGQSTSCWTDTFQPVVRIRRVVVYDDETKDGKNNIALVVSHDHQQALVEITVAMDNLDHIKNKLQPGELIRLTKFKTVTRCSMGCDSFGETSRAHHCKCRKQLSIHCDTFEWVPDFTKTQNAIKQYNRDLVHQR